MLLYEWAWVAGALGQPDRAAELFERIHREHRQGDYWADATFRLAKRAYDAKDCDTARPLADELLAAKAPAEIRESALNLRGRVAVAEEDWAAGRAAFERLIEEFPQSRHRILAEYWLADMTYREGKREEAARRFEQLDVRVRGLARREGWMAMVPLRRAQVLSQMRRWKDAYRVASGIEAQHPGFPLQYEADYVIGLCLATQADFEGARRAYEKVIESEEGAKTETAAMAEWMIGETYFHQKNYPAALRRYLRLRMRYDYPTWQALALLQAGKCREKLGEPLEAAKHYAELIETFPDSQYVEKARELLEALPPESAGAAAKSKYQDFVLWISDLERARSNTT
jgi:TolA-binding protein